jgi:hypothetical protein
MKAFASVLLVLAAGPVVFFACSAVEQPNIGSFNGLEALSAPKARVGGSGACTPDKYVFKTGDVCAISWTTDIYPKLLATGDMGCAKSSCHESTNGALEPYFFGLGVSPTPSGAYSILAASSAYPKRTINPCSKDPKDSYLYCNIGGAGVEQCGKPMPLGARNQATDPPPAAAASIQTWLQCGAPLN